MTLCGGDVGWREIEPRSTVRSPPIDRLRPNRTSIDSGRRRLEIRPGPRTIRRRSSVRIPSDMRRTLRRTTSSVRNVSAVQIVDDARQASPWASTSRSALHRRRDGRRELPSPGAPARSDATPIIIVMSLTGERQLPRASPGRCGPARPVRPAQEAASRIVSRETSAGRSADEPPSCDDAAFAIVDVRRRSGNDRARTAFSS